MTPRTYVPATLPLLARWHQDGAIPADTPRVAATGEDEESEYAALMSAAAVSQDLAPAGGRRVVLVAEVSEGAVSFADVVAVHCDTEDRPADADPQQDLAWFATQEIPDLI